MFEDGKLDFSTAFRVVQEMISHWPQIVAYISSTSQCQEIQHVEGRLFVFLGLIAGEFLGVNGVVF